MRPKDDKIEQWEGPRSGTQAAVDVFNADEVCKSVAAPTWLRSSIDWGRPYDRGSVTPDR